MILGMYFLSMMEIKYLFWDMIYGEVIWCFCSFL